MHYFGPEIWGGGAFAPNFTEFVVVNAHGVFSVHVAHNLDSKTVEQSAQRIVQGSWGSSK